jgi:glycosyltransferase involved in cell wall biosynthesis
MRILVGLTYYRPHISGLTIYVERLSRALVARGHYVTILTSQFDPQLPLHEVVDGVHIVRVPVVMRVSKGVIMPSLGRWASQLVREHDVISLHLPQFDAAGIAARGRLFGRPTILTYHCDLQLPPGLLNRVVDRVVSAANSAAGLMSDRVVAYTQDYADHAPLLRGLRGKLAVIPPPVVMPSPAPEEIEAFRRARGTAGKLTIGYASRFAAEKGIEYLVEAMPHLLERFPHLKVLFAGPYRDVIGEETYRQRLAPRIVALGDHWEFLGALGPEELPPFYGALDCLLVTSVNSTESFGLVQVEAMLCGTPVVASDLPGVRQPVRMTGMGEVVPVGDPAALAQGITKVLADRVHYVRPRVDVERVYNLDVTVSGYERLFAEELQKKSAGKRGQL